MSTFTLLAGKFKTNSSYPSTRGTQGAIRRNGHCVQVTIVTNVVGLQLAISKIPHLRDKNTRLTE